MTMTLTGSGALPPSSTHPDVGNLVEVVRSNAPPRDYVITVRDGAELEFSGRLIGYATSARDDHTHQTHDPVTGESRFVRDGDRCSACRWFEVRIFTVLCLYVTHCTCGAGDDAPDEQHSVGTDGRPPCGEVTPDGRYLVVTYGMTVVPGERPKRRSVWTNSAFEIIEILTQRNAGKSFLPATSGRVIAQAAASDDDIRDAYVNRAVT